MANPAADYPTALHSATDISADSSLPLGSTTPTHTQVHGKIEQEVLELQKKLGLGASPASGGTLRYILSLNSDLTSSWKLPDWSPFDNGSGYSGMRSNPNPNTGTYNQYFGGGTPYTVSGGITPGGNAVANLGSLRLNIFGVSAHGYSGTPLDYGPIVFFNNSRGTVDSPVAIQNGDNLGVIASGGWDGSDYSLSLNGVRFVVDGAVSAGTVPVKVQLLTNGTVVSELFNNGDITFYKVGGAVSMLHMDATNSYIGLGSIAGTLVNTFTVNLPITNDILAEGILGTRTATQKGLVIQGVVSQTANLQEWQDSTGAALNAITSAGNILFGKEAAHTITIADTVTAATAGGAFSITAGKGSPTTSGAGGALNLAAGAAQAGNSNGGAVGITGGVGAGVSNGGAVNINGGGGVTGGNVVINSGAGVANGAIRLAGTTGLVALGHTNAPGAHLDIRSRVAATVGLIVDNVAIAASIAQFKDNGTTKWDILDGGNMQAAAGVNMVFDTATGTIFGTATNQKMAWWAATPITQPSGNALTALGNLGLISSPTLAKADVGLGNVDNTSDATKNSATATLTNKRNTSRITAITSNANPTINTDNCDAVTITAQAADITSMTTNLTGTPSNFDKLIIRIKDDGSARAITWGTGFEAKGVALPTTTTISKVLTVGFLYDTVTSKWGCVVSLQEA